MLTKSIQFVAAVLAGLVGVGCRLGLSDGVEQAGAGFCPQKLVQPIRLEAQGGDVISAEGLFRFIENASIA